MKKSKLGFKIINLGFHVHLKVVVEKNKFVLNDNWMVLREGAKQKLDK